VKSLFANGDAALPDTDILLPEGTPDPDRWVWAFRDRRGERVGERFHRRTLPEQISDWFWYRSNSPFGTKAPDWRLVENLWHPSGDVLLVRPNWSARSLWPNCFPEPPKFDEEFERRAAEHREKTLARRKSKLARERAAENAKVNQAFEQRAIDAQRELYK
jgi:hypothetical protein